MVISSFRIKRRKKADELESEESDQCLSKRLLEEGIAPIEKYRSRPTLGVTTFSRQMWCERSLEICLERNIKVTSKAIEEGLKHHEELELEDHEVQNVIVDNEYEKIGIDMLSTVNLLNAIIERGYVRELPITGFFNGVMLRGIIDSIKLKPMMNNGEVKNEYTRSEISGCRILITDTKTRRNTTLPSNAQQKTTVIQLGLYKKILGEMINYGKDWIKKHSDITNSNLIFEKYSTSELSDHDLEGCCLGCNYLYKIFKLYDLDPFTRFVDYRKRIQGSQDPELKSEVKETENDEKNGELGKKDMKRNIFPIQDERNSNSSGDYLNDEEEEKQTGIDCLEALGLYENNVQIGFHMLFNLSKLPEIQNEMRVDYDCDGKTFATKWYKSPDSTIETELEYLLSWWLGHRDTESIRLSESWKCKSCNVIEYCQACPLPEDEKAKYIEQNKQNELDLILLRNLETIC